MTFCLTSTTRGSDVRKRSKVRRTYNQKNLADLRSKFQSIGPKTDRLLVRFVAHEFAEEKAREYARHGFARRIQTLRRCIQNVFKIVSPTSIKTPSKEKLHDAQINIQAAIANTYGYVDNLAWVWVYERGLSRQLKPRQVGLWKHNSLVRESLPSEFRSYLDSLEAWFEYLADYRHALAHRIPLYIPPGNVRPSDIDAYNDLTRRMNEVIRDVDEYERLLTDQNKLVVFRPVVGHSLSEMKAPYFFHAQLIADFLTVEELGEKMLAQLRGLK